MVVNVAKPIEPTPTLRGDDVTQFYKEMEKEEKTPNPRRVELISKSKEIYSKISRKF
jgi:hypothetical protein